MYVATKTLFQTLLFNLAGWFVDTGILILLHALCAQNVQDKGWKILKYVILKGWDHASLKP